MKNVRKNLVAGQGEKLFEESESDLEELEEPTLMELKEIDLAMQRVVGSFNGENMHYWGNFVKVFEGMCKKRNWERYPEDVLVELLSSRLTEKARKSWEMWILEEPDMMNDLPRFKSEFSSRTADSINPWKALVDFHGLRMKEEESIESYTNRYVKSRELVDEDGCEAVKYFFSLPTRIRELLSRHSGEWPKSLKGMIELSKEVVLRDETVNFYRNKSVPATTVARAPIICYGCGEKGHIASRCPNKGKINQDSNGSNDSNDSVTKQKNNSLKDQNYNYLPSSVYLNAVLNSSEKRLSVSALVDSGATANYISENVVCQGGIFKSVLNHRVKLALASKQFTVYAKYETETLIMTIGDHVEELKFIVVPELHDEVILGKAWLDVHNPLIDWPTGVLTFSRCCCSESRPNMVKVLDNDEIIVNNVVEYGAKLLEIPLTNSNEGNSDEENFDWYSEDDAEWTLDRNIDCITDDETEVTPIELEVLDQVNNEIEPTINVITKVQEVQEDESSVIVADILEEQQRHAGNIDIQIPKAYQDFAEVFSKKLADVLPPLNNKYQCAIEFKKDSILPKPRKPFPLSRPEREALAVFIDDNLKKGFIRKSNSPIAMGTFLVSKSNGEYRTVVDFRPVNEIVVDNRNPIPCIDDLMTYLNDARVFTKIDLRGAYNLLRMRPGDEWKTAFVCSQGQFEYTVMPFGLKTAPAIFQSMMEDIFSDLLRQSVLIYLDDILIFSKTEEEHEYLVREILSRLYKHRLLAKIEKCTFSSNTVDFLGYVISTEGISVAPEKVKAILDWPVPLRRRDLKSFLGTANFNRKFISGYSEIVAPLLALDSKEVKSFREAWTVKCDDAFNKLKQMMVSAPVLKHVNFNLPFIVETDASEFALGAVLLQPESISSLVLHPVAYASRKLATAERNYSVYDKELLGIVFALGKWHQFLFGALFPVKVFTDHSNLQYFKTRQLLNSRHLRWKLFLQNYDFRLSYRPGSANVVADALSRRVDFSGGENGTSATTSNEEELKETVLPVECWDINKETIDLKTITDQHYKQTVQDKEEQLSIMKTRHSNLAAGHFGRMRTYEAVSRDFYWPKMRKDIENFVDSCIICQKIKASRKKQFGKLMPLPIASGPWKSIALDFIVKLPVSNGFDSILVVVDRFSKMSHLIPCNETIDAPQTVDLLMKNVFKLHGLPMDMVSDRGPQFTSKFWISLCEQLGIQRKLSTAAHPQTDGQTERTNQTLEQYLRAYVNFKQDNWSNLLHFAEMAMNNAINSSTKRTPFEINVGYLPRFDFLAQENQHQVPAADEFVKHIQRIWIQTIQNLRDASEKMKRDTDHLRKNHKFKVGDFVWIDTKHLKRERPSSKLDYRRVGPYEIIERINENAYRLQFPEGSRQHDVINVSKLTPFVESELTSIDSNQAPEIINGFEEFEVEDILDSRTCKGKLLYLIKWKGYSEIHNSWEPEENLQSCGELIEKYLNKSSISI